MRKIIMLLATFVIASLLIVACGAEEGTPTSALETETPVMTEEPAVTETVEPGAGEGTGTPDAGIPVTGEEDPSRISNQLDYDVWNQNGEQIGEVNDMILDLDNEMVTYVIVGTGGFLEIGEKDVLVPWDQLMLSTEGGDATGGDQFAFILQADQELFENAPDWDVNTLLPPLGEPAMDWDAEIRSFWEGGVVPETGTGTPATEATAAPDTTATVSPDATAAPEGTAAPGGTTTGELQGVVLATEFLGSTITVGAETTVSQGPPPLQGTPVPPGTAVSTTPMPGATATLSAAPGTTTGEVTDATVDDVIVDIDTGDILYIVLNAVFDDGERWVPVPLNQFGWDAANGAFVLNVDQATFASAPSLVDGQYPDTTVEGWDAEFSTFWQDGGTGTDTETEPTATPSS
jgi:sporulation protein YlmC with PRC-barrel domain